MKATDPPRHVTRRSRNVRADRARPESVAPSYAGSQDYDCRVGRRHGDRAIERLDLEHPDLDPFEPRIRDLADLAMGALGRLARRKNVPPKELFGSDDPTIIQEIRRECHVAFEEAQQAIGLSVMDLEVRVRAIERAVKDHRRSRRTVVREIEHIRVLNHRILVLRRLVDAIAHQMIGMKPWIARRFTVERSVRRVDPEQLKLLLTLAATRNAEDVNRFALVADLTTFVQICDLVEVVFAAEEHQIRLIEVKEGRVNEEILSAEGAGMESLDDAKASKRLEQVKRMKRQQSRLSNAKRILDTDEGTDPVSGMPLRMSGKELIFEGYGRQLGELVKRSREAGGARLTIDSSLRLVGVRDTALDGASMPDVVHQCHHMGGRNLPCLLDAPDPAPELKALSNEPMPVDMVLFSTRAMWALPVFLWEVEPESVFELLAGRVRVFAQVHGEDFRGLLSAVLRLDSKWLSRAESSKYRTEHLSSQIPGAPRNVTGLRVIGPREGTYFSGFFWRMVGDQARPSDLIGIIALDQDRIWPSN